MLERAQAIKFNLGRTLNVCCLYCFCIYDSGNVSEFSQGLEAMEEVVLCPGR